MVVVTIQSNRKSMNECSTLSVLRQIEREQRTVNATNEFPFHFSYTDVTLKIP